MSYLFDKKGEPDDDLKALEEKLLSARASPPKQSWAAQAASREPMRLWRVVLPLAAAIACAVIYAQVPRAPAFTVTTSWGISRLEQGRWLETTERAEIAVADIGHVTVEPQSRVRLVETSKQVHRLELARGELHAKVNAPPRLFVVDTPAAKAVDLGCEYRLTVDAEGATRLEVLRGEVSLEGRGAASRVSAGATCLTRRGQAPGVPRSLRSGPAFAQALDTWEAQGGAVTPVLATAERGDAISLWNMLPRVDPQQRPEVLARLKSVIAEPVPNVTDADVMKLQQPAMESLWQAFP
jgi:hypothetical protein